MTSKKALYLKSPPAIIFKLIVLISAYKGIKTGRTIRSVMHKYVNKKNITNNCSIIFSKNLNMIDVINVDQFNLYGEEVSSYEFIYYLIHINEDFKLDYKNKNRVLYQIISLVNTFNKQFR